ncbi:MAG: hypothetical protein CL521_05610 [Actinobacteria bacterium]|nr:hypothetical protein [Actinomycetota bacterium]
MSSLFQPSLSTSYSAIATDSFTQQFRDSYLHHANQQVLIDDLCDIESFLDSEPKSSLLELYFLLLNLSEHSHAPIRNHAIQLVETLDSQYMRGWSY